MSSNPLNGIESLETTMAAAAHAQEKPKAKERRLTNKNVKQVYEELNDVDELLQDVLNVCSSVTNGYTLSCKCDQGPVIQPSSMSTSLMRARAWHKGGAVWLSINHGWTLLPLMRSCVCLFAFFKQTLSGGQLSNFSN